MLSQAILFLDFETRSKVDLKKQGSYIYATDPSTEVIILGYRFSKWPSGEVKFWEPPDKEPKEIIKHILNRGPIVAHNYRFEYYILSYVLGSSVDLSQFRCTLATALHLGLPPSLDKLSKALKLTNQKKTNIKETILNKYSKPKKDGTFREIPDHDYKLIKEYNKADVLAMEEAYYKMPKLHENAFEYPIFELDKEINYKGLQIDTQALGKIEKAYGEYQVKARKEALKLCGMANEKTLMVSSPQFKTWLSKETGLKVPNAQAYTLSQLAKRKIPKHVQKALGLRRVIAGAAPKKIYKIKEQIDDKGIIRDYIQYHGAHTGRWAGRGFQPQNLPKIATKNYKKDLTDLVNGTTKIEDTPEVFNGLLRGLIIPRKDHVFFVGDFKTIEARILMWLAGDEKGLKAFRDGRDIYKEMASMIFRKPVERIDELQRDIGKRTELGAGYGIGPEKFRNTVKEQTKGFDIGQQLAETAVYAYRAKHPLVPKYWKDIERELIDNLQKGKKYLVLPSGRLQHYPGLHLRDNKLHFYHSRFGLKSIWGGVITENLDSGIARDIMAVKCQELTKQGIPFRLTVHDEIVCEVPKKDAKKKFEIFKKIMSTPPAWANDLPLAAECEILTRYAKI